MKNNLILVVMLLLTYGMKAQVKTTNIQKDYAVISFEETNHDFGTLNEGDIVKFVYHFTNTGEVPLVIKRIKASCGCTVPSNWKKEPIMPGEKSAFTVKFNTRSKINKQHKVLTIYANTLKGMERAYFVANVIPDPKMEKARKERRERMMKKRAEAKKKRDMLGKKQKSNAKKSSIVLSATPSSKDLESKQKALKKQEKSLNKQEKQLTQDIKKVKKIEKWQKKITDKKSDIHKMEKKIKSLKTDIRKLENKIQTYQK